MIQIKPKNILLFLTTTLLSTSSFAALKMNPAQEHYTIILLIFALGISLLLALLGFTYLLKKQHKQLTEQQKKLEKTQHDFLKSQTIAKIGNWAWQAGDEALYWSDGIYSIFEVDHDATISYDLFLSMVDEADLDFVKASVQQSIETHKPYNIFHKIITAKGSQKIVHENAIVEANENGQIMLIGTVQDVTDTKKMETELEANKNTLEFMANYDHLTGLPNKTQFMKRVKQAGKSARRYEKQFAIFYMDLDKFKSVNDGYGHEYGDLVLQECANRLKNIMRESDTISRFGGDEFIILIEENPTPEELAIIANRVIHTISEPYNIKGKTFNLSCSIGIGIFPDDGDSCETLLKNSDSAMYEAKESGRADYRFYKKAYTEKILHKIEYEQKIVNALKQNEFYLVYQPIIALENSQPQIAGMEALIRWKSDGKFIPPDQFIPLAEDTKLIIPIGLFVIEEAFKTWQEFKEMGVDVDKLKLNVNTSIVQLQQPKFLEDVKSLLSQFTFSPKTIVFEITESFILEDNPTIMKNLIALQEIGIRISIDDFGTGYSSLSRIQTMPISEIKIDKSFVNNITANNNQDAIINTIVSLAKNLNYDVVAEGIEIKEQEQFLQEIKCKYGQGYFYHKPLDKSVVTQLLLEKQ